MITLAIALGIGEIACSKDGIVSGPGESGATTVRIRNATTVSLTEIVVLTSDVDSVVVAALAPGQATAPHAISEMHEDVAYHVKVAGTPTKAVLIEGFSGFNPKLGPGAYEVRFDAVPGMPSGIEVAATVAKLQE